jgi:hypothetical protein
VPFFKKAVIETKNINLQNKETLNCNIYINNIIYIEIFYFEQENAEWLKG